MNKIALIVSASGLLILFLLWALIEYALSGDCRKLNSILSNEKERSEVISFINEISESPGLAGFLEGTRGQLFSFMEIPDLNVDIPGVLSHKFDNLNLFILTNQDGKGFSEEYEVLELGVGTPGALLVFENSNSEFSFGSDYTRTGVGVKLDSPTVKCHMSKR